MRLLNQTYSVQQVAAATGVTAKQVSDWCNMGLIVGQRKPLGRGHRRELSWFNVMEVACALALMDVGMTSPGDAFRAAQKLAHAGDNDQLPGLPHHHNTGETFLYVSGERSVVMLLAEGDKHPKNPIPNTGENLRGFIALNITDVFVSVCARIGGLHGFKVLDEAYPEAATS
ncbi:hypothetical protein [Sulfitobacter pontiacus]|uniref:hypothetical protein n=1 Tax=Sulfitobacter pontiacus TaxID=60137 RepID=UPI0030EB5323